MRKETVDLLEMMDIPLTKDLKDLLDQMDKWDLPDMPEIPSIPETHSMPRHTRTITTTDGTGVDDERTWATSDRTWTTFDDMESL